MNNRYGDRFRADDRREPRRFHEDDGRETTRRFDDREPHYGSSYESRGRMGLDRDDGDRFSSERFGGRNEGYSMDRGAGGFGSWREDAQRRERSDDWRSDMDRDRWREDMGYGRQAPRTPQRFSGQIDRGYDRGMDRGYGRGADRGMGGLGYDRDTDRGFGGMGYSGSSSSNYGGGMGRGFGDDDRGFQSGSLYGGMSQGFDDWRDTDRWHGQKRTLGQRLAAEHPYQQQRYPSGPKGYKRSDERIREDICDALCSAYEIDSSDVEIKVQNGEVTITGTVPDRQTKLRIEHLADRMSGVNEVTNQVRIKRNQQQSQQLQGQRQQGAFGEETDQNGRRANVTGRA